MDSYSPIVITSKLAENHLNSIKAKHADILQGMQAQAQKIATFNQEKAQQAQMENERSASMKMENDKAAIDAQTRMLEQQNKQRELDIKAQALSI